jgi:hypothetical protein
VQAELGCSRINMQLLITGLGIKVSNPAT